MSAVAAGLQWRTTVIERGVHRGVICTPTRDDGDRFAGDHISAHMDTAGHAHLVWVRDTPGQPTPGRTQIRYASMP